MKLSEIIEAYRDYFERGELPYILCQSCGYAFYYCRDFCPKCASNSIVIRRSVGEGKVFSATRIHTKNGGKIAYGIVQLREGFRMYCNLDEEQEEARIDAAISIIFKEINGKKYPYGKIVGKSSNS